MVTFDKREAPFALDWSDADDVGGMKLCNIVAHKDGMPLFLTRALHASSALDMPVWNEFSLFLCL